MKLYQNFNEKHKKNHNNKEKLNVSECFFVEFCYIFGYKDF